MNNDSSNRIVSTSHLFPVLDKMLLQLLQSLNTDEWEQLTIAKLWTVKDIAAHLLDGNIRMLAASRDQFLDKPDTNIHTYSYLVAYLNQLNAQWVLACKRMSPAVLIDLLKHTGQQFATHVQSLHPFEPAIFSVAWAGEAVSQNWFHIAREYTEKFIHQQQIRDAVGKQALFTKELFYPFIATCIHAMPHTYKNVAAPVGTSININISTDIGGTFSIVKNELNWELLFNLQPNAEATINIAPDTAWKLFSKGITPQQAREQIQIMGNVELGAHVCKMVSVMA